MQEESVSKKQEKRSSHKEIAFIRFLPLFLTFFLGFLTHAYFFPDLLPQTLSSYARKAVGMKEPVTLITNKEVSKGDAVALIKHVAYSDGVFSPSVVRVHYGNYISIMNVSKLPDDLMWLVSDSPELTTPRGFAESEHLQRTLLKEGSFVVSNKLRPESKLQVIVYR